MTTTAKKNKAVRTSDITPEKTYKVVYWSQWFEDYYGPATIATSTTNDPAKKLEGLFRAQGNNREGKKLLPTKPSMSKGDILIFSADDGEILIYYCSSVGWLKLTPKQFFRWAEDHNGDTRHRSFPQEWVGDSPMTMAEFWQYEKENGL